MKPIITAILVTISLLAFSASAQAQTVQIPGAPSNFSKAKFKKLLHMNGISQQEFNQIGLYPVINSLHKQNGVWKFYINNSKKQQLIFHSNGKLNFFGAEIGSDELMDAELGSDEFTDIVVGGTTI